MKVAAVTGEDAFTELDTEALSKGPWAAFEDGSFLTEALPSLGEQHVASC